MLHRARVSLLAVGGRDLTAALLRCAVAIVLSAGPPIDNYGTLQFEAAAEIVTVGKEYTEGKIAEIKENWGDAVVGAPPQSSANRVSFEVGLARSPLFDPVCGMGEARKLWF